MKYIHINIYIYNTANITHHQDVLLYNKKHIFFSLIFILFIQYWKIQLKLERTVILSFMVCFVFVFFLYVISND